MSNNITIGIVGARGLVGLELIKLFKNTKLKLCASNKNPEKLELDGNIYDLDILDNSFFDNLKFVFFCADNETSKLWIPYILENHKNCYVIDNSSEFRLAKFNQEYQEYPLVIPEINFDSIYKYETKLITNPNCCTAILCMLLFPLMKISKIKKINVSTYQAVSGAGKNGILELNKQIEEYCENNERTDYTISTFKSQIFANCFSHNTKIDLETKYNDEELKIIQETKKILNEPNIKISATCIRIPVFRTHTESVTVKFENEISEYDIYDILYRSSGIKVVDDIINNKFPEPVDATNKTDILVGRIRSDIDSTINGKSKIWHFMICGDQLLKGASYNAFQIYKKLNNLL